MKLPNSQADSTVHDVLQLIRQIKYQPNRSKGLSQLDFSSRSDFRQPLKSQTLTRQNVFEKLYKESKQKQYKRQLIQYQTRRSREERQKSQCTFSPNLSRRLRTSDINNESFYEKNMEWLERRQKSIKIKQCQKNQENHKTYSFTPKINKPKKFKNDAQEKKGVDDYYQRLNRAKNNKKFVQQRRKNPYSHVWTVKKGCFSNPYIR